MSDQKPILLLVEDDAIIAEDLQQKFSKDFDVRAFYKGEDALEALKDIGQPVVMLTDNGLAGNMTGFGLIKSAREIHPAMPIVMLSGWVGGRDQERLQAWDIPFLRKPVILREVEQAVMAAQKKLEGGKSPMDHAKRPPQSGGLGGLG